MSNIIAALAYMARNAPEDELEHDAVVATVSRARAEYDDLRAERDTALAAQRKAEEAASLFAENEHRVVALCKDVVVNVDDCGGNAVSCVDVLCEDIVQERAARRKAEEERDEARAALADKAHEIAGSQAFVAAFQAERAAREAAELERDAVRSTASALGGQDGWQANGAGPVAYIHWLREQIDELKHARDARELDAGDWKSRAEAAEKALAEMAAKVETMRANGYAREQQVLAYREEWKAKLTAVEAQCAAMRSVIERFLDEHGNGVTIAEMRAALATKEEG